MDLHIAVLDVIIGIIVAMEVKCPLDSCTWFARAKDFACNIPCHCILLRNGSLLRCVWFPSLYNFHIPYLIHIYISISEKMIHCVAASVVFHAAIIITNIIASFTFATEVKCPVDSLSWFERAKNFGCNSLTNGEYHCSLLSNGSFVEMCMISELIPPAEGKT